MISMFLRGLVFCSLPVLAHAESVPEFVLEHVKEKANTIVVVDHTGLVLESWRGDLKTGAKLHFKADDKPRAVSEVPKLLESEVDEVTGKRRILFLIRTGGGRGFDRSPIGYAPASYLKPDISLATVWVEKGECFAIYQWRNPGDGAKLHPLNLSEEDLKKKLVAE